MIAAKEVPKHRKMTIDEILGHIFKGVGPSMSGLFQWMMITLGVIVLNLIPFGLIFMSLSGRYLNWYSDPSFSLDQLGGGTLTAAIVALIVVLIVDLIYSFFTSTWYVRLSLDAYSHVERSFSERMGKVLKDFKRLIPIFLLSFVGFGLLFAFLFIVALSSVDTLSYDGTGSSIDGLNGIVNIVSFLLSARLSSWLFLMVEDELGLFEALKATWTMSKGRMMRILGYILLFAVIIFFCVIGMMLGFGILWVPAIVSDFNIIVVSITGFVTAVGLLFMSAVLTSVENNFYCAIYHALKRENTPEEEPTAAPPDELIF